MGWLGGVLIDRVPDRLALRPLPGVRVKGRYLAVQMVMLALFVAVGIRFDDAPALLIAGYLLLTADAGDGVGHRHRLLPPARPHRAARASCVSVVIVVVESLRERAPDADRATRWPAPACTSGSCW